MSRKPLRQTMPRTAELIDALREHFGAAEIDQAICNGLAGGTDFWASEQGVTLGNHPAPPGAHFTADQLQLPEKAKPCN
jgi:hypothetical protein